MKEFKGTSGPWVVDANGMDARWNIDDLNGNSIALTHQLPNDKDWQKRDANTRLIAAAPELLEQLQAVVAWLEQGDVDPSFIDAMYAAIAKAVGEENEIH